MSGALVALALALAGGGDPRLERLAGHDARVVAGELVIEDVAGEGRPRVGVVERRGDVLWLVESGGAAWRLRGPLAVPRIAGPGYQVWVLGPVRGDELAPRRLGVLAPPPR